MSYSTFIHSGIVNPAKPNLVKENSDQTDTITFDIPLLTRLLEVAREDLKSDEDLHNLISRLIELKNQGVLTMNDYPKIVGPTSNNDPELESILKLAGI
jgi:hypothetical protein